MPSLRLTEDEALALTTYLMTLGEKPEPDAAVVARLEHPANVAKGERLVRKYGCALAATTSRAWRTSPASASS